MPELSIVVPCFNEEEVLPELHRRVSDTMGGIDFELVLVNDGSRDGTLARMLQLHELDPRVVVLDLSRNFGHQLAITAGLDHARGAAVVVMDADLQDPPEVVLELVERWREGYDVVYAVRSERDGEGRLKRGTAWLFYRVMRVLSPVDIPSDAGDFRLMSRRAVEALGQLRERHRYVRGMARWIGYRQAAVTYRREARFAGRTKYPALKMLRLAIDAVLSFSTLPLRVATLMGALLGIVCLAYAAYEVFLRVSGHPMEPGWASLIVAVLFVGGVQMMCLGILGEYVGRIYDEVRGRPLYLVGQLHRALEQAPDNVRNLPRIREPDVR